MPFLAAIPAAMSAIGSVAGAVGGVAGAIGGIGGKKTAETTTSQTSATSGLRLTGPSALEQQATAGTAGSFADLQGLLAQGPGATDVTAGTQSSRDLAALLQQYQQTGGMPSAQDIAQAQGFAGQMFAGQRLGAQQATLEAQQQYAQQAAIQGRGGLDPILRNKLAEQQRMQEQQIGAQQMAFGAQQAQGISQNRLAFAGQRANVLGGLASQAMSNRQALLSMGSQLQAAERNFRLATAEKYGTETKTGTATKEEPGGLLGGITGAMAGAGAGVQGVQGLANLWKSPVNPEIGGAPSARLSSLDAMKEAMYK